jgi:phosphate transport system substrate-binding protein
MRILGVLGMGAILLALFLQCWPTTPPEATPTEAPTSEPAAPTPIEASPAPTFPPVAKPDLTAIAADYPRVDGSTSTYPLQMVLACKILGVPCVWDTDPFTRLRRIAPDPTYQGSPQPVERLFNIQHNGTHGSYMNLIEGTTDLILVARSPSKDELDAARAKGIALDVRPVALDAFVFLLNAENPVDSLTIETVRGIYTGEITSWAEVRVSGPQGGDLGGEIHAYQRNPNSGSQELMETLVMRDEPMIEAPDMILETMMGPVNAIAEDPLGIGYSVYFYAEFIFPEEKVKLCGIDGMEPTSDNIAKRAYPLTTEVYAVVRQGMPEDSTAMMLRNWLLTEEGQAAIAESGYVSIS